MSNLLNGVLHFGFEILLQNMGKRKKEDDPFWGKKIEVNKTVPL